MNRDMENQRTNNSIRCTGRISPKLRERQSKNPSIPNENIARNFHWICFDRGENLEGRQTDCWYWRSGKVGRIRNIFQKTECTRSLYIPEKGEIVFLVVDGSAKLSGRDCEFQEPTLRRESTVRRENLSGESQGLGKSFDLKKQKMTQEATRTFGPLKVISLVVIILNREFNNMCRKNNCQFHWSKFM